MRILSETEISSAGLAINAVGIFNDIEDSELSSLSSYGEWVEAENELIVEDGTEQEYIFLVSTGSVEVNKNKDSNGRPSKKQIFATMGRGDCFGEMALLSGGLATANVRAVEKVVFWRILHSDLLDFAAEFVGGKQLILNVASILSARLVEGNQKIIGLANEFSAYLKEQQKKNPKGSVKKDSIDSIEKRLAEIQKTYSSSATEVKKSRPVWVLATISCLFVFSLLANVWFVQNQNSFSMLLDQSNQQITELSKDNRDLRSNKDKLLNSYTQLMEDVQSSLKSILQLTAAAQSGSNTDPSQNLALDKLMLRLDETQTMIDNNRSLENKIAQLQQQNEQLLKASKMNDEAQGSEINSKDSKNRYALMKKTIIRGPRVAHPKDKDSSGRPLQIQAKDRYFFICRSEATKSDQIYEVNPRVYSNFKLRELFRHSSMDGWILLPKFPTANELKKQFLEDLIAASQNDLQSSEIDYDGSNSGSNSADDIFNQLTKGIESGF